MRVALAALYGVAAVAFPPLGVAWLIVWALCYYGSYGERRRDAARRYAATDIAETRRRAFPGLSVAPSPK